ncbi:MAG: M28 family peptidase [Caldilineaceae bacterium]
MQYLRLYRIEFTLVAALAAAIAFFGYLGYGLVYTTPRFSGVQSLNYVAKQIENGGRVTGTSNNQAVRNWLANELGNAGWKVYLQPFTLANQIQAQNVIGVYKNPTPNASVVLLAAHYDTRLVADADPAQENQSTPPPGANSNASGVGVLLELVRTLNLEKTDHTLCIAFFDADDNAELADWQPYAGSYFFAQNLAESLDVCNNPRAIVLLDSIGYSGQTLSIAASNNPALGQSLEQIANELGYGAKFQSASPATLASPLAQLNSPTVIVTDSTYPYRYTLQDTLDKVNSDNLMAVGRTLEAWLERGSPF